MNMGDYSSLGDNSSSPHSNFKFKFRKTLNIDISTDILFNVLNHIAINKGYYFDFTTKHEKNIATGNGATRQVYCKLADELMKELLVQKNNYFMDINVDNAFWESYENIESFGFLIEMIIKSGCILPYHFTPALLEIISNQILTLEQLEFFMEKIDPDLLVFAKKVNPSDFESLDTNFKSHEEFYRSIVIGTVDEKKMTIYCNISNCFESIDGRSILDIDRIFSGNYTITANDVLSCTILTERQYQDIWNQFINSLTEKELKQLMILFRNTLSLKERYDIIVKNIDIDIHIEICFKKVTINQKLFENLEYLNNLKNYFVDNDNIHDSNVAYDSDDSDDDDMPPLEPVLPNHNQIYEHNVLFNSNEPIHNYSLSSPIRMTISQVLENYLIANRTNGAYISNDHR